MKRVYLKEKDILFIFFSIVILAGAILLSLPLSWQDGAKPGFIDILFTSVSAVCVTGLSTVSITNMSLPGQIFLLIFIQIGGLGLITFSSMFLTLPRQKLTLANSKLIRNYFLDEEIVDPSYIIRIVLRFTIIIEFLGAILLYISFTIKGMDVSFFTALFHSISAFCNAGFSTLPNGLTIIRDDLFSNMTFMMLIITGGMGFMILVDLYDKFTGRDSILLLHTRIMLISTLVLIVSGGVLYYIFEYNSSTMDGLNWYEKILPSFFQSITTRTAGFNTIELDRLSMPSKVISLGYMLIGGGSGSTAGGIKVTTAFLLIWVVVQVLNDNGGISIYNRKISQEQITRAALFFGKAIAIVTLAIIGLSISESLSGSNFSFMDLTFESFSAIATVGLSLGITGELSLFSKIILICTMFAGRIGLFALILPSKEKRLDRTIEYPNGEVLIG